MAVVSSKTAQETRKSDTTESEETKGKGFANEGKEVDIFNTKGLFEGDTVELDPTEDAWKRSAPPPRGLYFIKSFPPKAKFVTLRHADNNPDIQWYEISAESKIIDSTDAEFDDLVVFPRVSTYIGRGKNISTAAGWVARTGYALLKDGKLNHLEVATYAAKIIKQEPINLVLLDWSGWSDKDKTVICKSMADFPIGDDGMPMHEFTRTAKDGTPEQITASLKVRLWVQKRKKDQGGGWDVSDVMNIPSYAQGIKTNGKHLEPSGGTSTIVKSVAAPVATTIVKASTVNKAGNKKVEEPQTLIPKETANEESSGDDELLIIEE